MPRKTDHQQARAALAKVAPESLQAFSARFPAGLLIEVHRWAEEKGLDLATAVRELTTLGLEAANRPDSPSPTDRKEMKRWAKDVEKALREGQSPFEPFLKRDQPDVTPLAAILAKMDYQAIYERVKDLGEKAEPAVERRWERMKEEAQLLVKESMTSLDRLEKRFLARKQLSWAEEGEFSCLHWLLSDAVMEALEESPAADADIDTVKQLITARYLVAPNPNKPWDFEWDE
jgi:hypothetical protein